MNGRHIVIVGLLAFVPAGFIAGRTARAAGHEPGAAPRAIVGYERVRNGEGGAAGAPDALEQKVWRLHDDAEAPFVSLGEADFRALGGEFVLPDGGRAVTALAQAAPGGAFDPRDVARLDPAQLGYRADWVVERFRRYNLDWDIGALRLTSQD